MDDFTRLDWVFQKMLIFMNFPQMWSYDSRLDLLYVRRCFSVHRGCKKNSLLWLLRRSRCFLCFLVFWFFLAFHTILSVNSEIVVFGNPSWSAVPEALKQANSALSVLRSKSCRAHFFSILFFDVSTNWSPLPIVKNIT